MNRIPRPNEIYQHFKGSLYKVITLAKHSETEEIMVVYQALYGSFEIYVRPLDSFVSEVDHQKYPDAEAKYRFTLIPEIWGQGENAAPVSSSEPEQSADPQVCSQEDEFLDDDEFALDPMLMKFLDADTHKEKLDILIDAHECITDSMLNTMAVSLDLELSEEDLEGKYQELKNCLIMFEKYESNRLR